MVIKKKGQSKAKQLGLALTVTGIALSSGHSRKADAMSLEIFSTLAADFVPDMIDSCQEFACELSENVASQIESLSDADGLVSAREVASVLVNNFDGIPASLAEALEGMGDFGKSVLENSTHALEGANSDQLSNFAANRLGGFDFGMGALNDLIDDLKVGDSAFGAVEEAGSQSTDLGTQLSQWPGELSDTDKAITSLMDNAGENPASSISSQVASWPGELSDEDFALKLETSEVAVASTDLPHDNNDLFSQVEGGWSGELSDEDKALEFGDFK